MTDEKIYDIPLRKFYTESTSKKKVPHAVKGVRDYIAKRTRSQNVLLSTDVNELLWSRGISHPPAKIRVKVRKDGEKVIAELISATPAAELKAGEAPKEAAADGSELKKQDEQKA